ncbi:uncharacterized protein ACO6RY_11784 [Pungitius sinensis]
MPAILVASKMKSGLPKPVHSARPIPQTHSRPPAPALLPAPIKAGAASGSEEGEDSQVRMAPPPTPDILSFH